MGSPDVKMSALALSDDNFRRPFKIVDWSREVRLGLTAASLMELTERARNKFDISPSEEVRVVLEVDGTEIDDNDYFNTLEPDTTLMILWDEKQKWTPYRSILTLGLALEPSDETRKSCSNSTPSSPVEDLVWRLNQDLSFFPWLTLKELENISKMDREEMRKIVPDEKFLEFLQNLCERYLQDKGSNKGSSVENILHDPIRLIRMYSNSAHVMTNYDQNLRRTN